MSFAKSKRFSYSAAPSEKENLSSVNSSKHVNNLARREGFRKNISHSKSVGSEYVTRNSKLNDSKRSRKKHSPAKSTNTLGNSCESINIGTIFSNCNFEQQRSWDDFEGELERIKEECLNIDYSLKKYDLTKNGFVAEEEIPKDNQDLSMKVGVNLAIENASVKIKKLFEETVSTLETETEKELQCIFKKINRNNAKFVKEAQNKCQQALNHLNETVNEAMMERVGSEKDVCEYESDQSLIFEDALSESLTWDDLDLDSPLISEQNPCQQKSSEEAPGLKPYSKIQNTDEQQSIFEILSEVPIRIYIQTGYEKMKHLYGQSLNKWTNVMRSLKTISKNFSKWKRPYNSSVLGEKEKKIAEQTQMIDILVEVINANTMEEELSRILKTQEREK